MTAVELLRSVAEDFHVRDIGTEGNRWHCEVDVPLPSHETVVYRLAVWLVNEATVGVRELPGGRLPAACPERHINAGGSFCLNWSEGDPLSIVDKEGAGTWWALLNSFLSRQETAATLRRWVGPAFAHGAAAAHQNAAELAAKRLGGKIESRLSERALSVRQRRQHWRVRIELLDGENVIARLQPDGKTLSNRQMLCVCGGSIPPSPISRCGTHLEDLTGLIVALNEWSKAEQQYLHELKNARFRCCGTLDSCPLK
jgi:hypothetical protein